MISNITNALPTLLKNIKENNDYNQNGLKFNLVETIKFFNSIMDHKKPMAGLKHMYLDSIFVLNEKNKDLLKTFCITLDTFPFLKEFDYEINENLNAITIRSNYEELAILSLILLGSIKSLSNDITIKNKSIFISLATNFLTFCVSNGYNVCKSEDIKILENYNESFDTDMFSSIILVPTSESKIGTIHFIGVELNKDINVIFEKYKNVKFTYNEEDSSFIISMASKDWDDFWANAPTYLKDEFSQSDD